MAVAHDIGSLGEQLALRFLMDRGFSLVERNVFVDGYELDIVVVRDATVVAVEVKTTTRAGDPVEAVNDSKASYLLRAVSAYRLAVHRIDVVGVTLGMHGATIRWLKGAL